MSHAFHLALRFWDEMIARPTDSLAFRFILQPGVAAALAIRDGVKDAHNGRAPYFWTILHEPGRRRTRLIGGIKAVGQVLILAAAIDVIYQLVVLHGIRPVQTAVVAFTLAFVPYLVVRGPATRIARRFLEHRRPQSPRGR